MNYNSMLKEKKSDLNHEGAKAYAMAPELELYSAVVTASLSDSFYSSTETPQNYTKKLEDKQVFLRLNRATASNYYRPSGRHSRIIGGARAWSKTTTRPTALT